MLPLVIAPADVLRRVAIPLVFPLTPSDHALAQALVEAMVHYHGIGLAAPQVGHSLRMITVAAGSAPKVYINPEIKKSTWKKVDFEEGCLSLPGLFGLVRRPSRVIAHYADLDGAWHDEWLTGLPARVYQHEVDHLNGVLFFDLTDRITQGQELLAGYQGKKYKFSMAFPSYTYFGTTDFSALILAGLLQQSVPPKLVVTTVAKPAGRGLKVVPNPVSALAKQAGVSVLAVSSLRDSAVVKQILQQSTDVGILAAFGKILPQEILQGYPHGIVNVHPSLLPKYRGPAPISSSLRDGCMQTGLTLIKLDEQVDHGPILAQAVVDIVPEDDAVTLGHKLALQAIPELLRTVPAYIAGTVVPVEQNHSQASFTTLVKREQGYADFSQSSERLHNLQRAFVPWPGLWTTWQGKRLKLVETGVLDENRTGSGSVLAALGRVYIVCGQGLLELKQVQLEGGKAQSIQDFLRGHAAFASAILPG